MGYMLATAVLVVTLGRLGDIYGRVRIYNAGFALFTVTSIALSLDPMSGAGGAQWLIWWRVLQAIGGSMLMANSAAIINRRLAQTKQTRRCDVACHRSPSPRLACLGGKTSVMIAAELAIQHRAADRLQHPPPDQPLGAAGRRTWGRATARSR